MGILGFIFLILLNLSNKGLLADQIFPASAGGTFGRSSREPKYKIEFHLAESPYHPDSDQDSVVMHDKKGKSYLCFLPTIEESKNGKSTPQLNTSSMIVESDRRFKLKTPDELLEVLKGGCFVRQEGWWAYEFCYQKHLRQFHVGDDNKAVQEFILGLYNPEATTAFNHNRSDVFTLKDPRSKDASQRYHAHQYTNGTGCDLTNQPRETEVRFVCAGTSVMVTSVKEISTCKYAITVQCPMLCTHPMFKEERPVWHTINCNEMPGEEANNDGQAEKHFDEERRITMITNSEIPTQYDQEQYAT